MRRLIAALAVLALGSAAAAQERIVLGLSEDQVAITATFDGSDILIFGAVKRDGPPAGAPLDLAIAVSGPLQPLIVRHANRRLGVWVNTSSIEVDAAPSFYAVATTRAFSAVLSDTEDLRHAVSIPRAIRAVGTEVGNREDYIEALIRIRTREGRYRVIEGGVDLAEETLFRARIDLPANLVEGDYLARIFLARDGRVIDILETDIAVRKVGIERWLHALSLNQPLAYGALALSLAVAAGWAAAAAFRALRG